MAFLNGTRESSARCRGRLRAIALCVLVLFARPAAPESDLLQEYHLKATFLFNLAKFIQWPDSRYNGPLTILVFGRDPLGNVLEQAIEGKTVNDRPLVVRRSTRLEELKPCDLLFISVSERKRLPEILLAVSGEAVLTVSEIEDFLHAGGIVNFTIERQAVRFHISPRAARQAGLRISSRLLSLTRLVSN